MRLIKSLQTLVRILDFCVSHHFFLFQAKDADIFATQGHTRNHLTHLGETRYYSVSE